jgi:glycosyltransferase involved in cell wall biosynthesis
MRYIWDAQQDYRLSRSRNAVFQLFLPRLRRWDAETAARVDYFIANSQFVQSRIQKFYDRSSEVIAPPIDTDFFRLMPSESRANFYVAAGAMVPYKRLDILVQAFNRLGRPLVLTGNGPEFHKLRMVAGSNIEMPGWVSREALRDLFCRARAFVLTAREDFGMATVEAQSCGCPAIALGAGGALETVEDSVNGLLFREQRHEDLMDAVCRFESMMWPPQQVRSKVESFSRDVFQNKIRRFVAARFAKLPEAQQSPLAIQTA